jgi:Fic family protein
VPLSYTRQINALLKLSLGQAELAADLGVTRATLNRWLNAGVEPHKSHLERINKLYRERVQYSSLGANDLKRFIADAKRLTNKKLWKQIAANEKLQDELILQHTYNSTTIEGTTFTKHQASAVIFDKANITNKTLIEHLEVINHAALSRDIFEQDIDSLKITEELILDLHSRLMQGISDDAGSYSRHHRAIRGLDIQLCHSDDIEDEMRSLLSDWNKPRTKTIADIAKFHADFELIHPFGDGNGRIGRMLMVMQCLVLGYPPVIVEYKRKADYYAVLEYAQTESELPLIEFLVEEMQETALVVAKYI